MPRQHLAAPKATKSMAGFAQRDDFDKFLSHADFGKILELAGCLKAQKQQLVSLTRGQQQSVSGSSGSLSSSLMPSKKKQRSEASGPGLDGGTGVSESGAGPPALAQKGGTEFDSAAELIRSALLPSPKEGPVPTMARGECLITDSLVDETIKSLAQELKLCLDLKKQVKSAACPGVGGSGSESAKLPASKPGGGGAVKKTGGRLAQKHSKRQTDVMTNWMIEHREHPFPTQDEIKALSIETGLTETQVVNWTTNVRKRNLKATVEGGKKPHHFLDYLFLATDREKKMKAAHPHLDFSFLKQFSPQKMSGLGLQQPPQGQMLQQPAFGFVNAEQPSTFAFGPPPPPPLVPYQQQQQPSTFAFGPPPPPPAMPMGYQHTGYQPDASSNIFRMPRNFQENISPTTGFVQQERERAVLQKHSAPNFTPPGCFGRNDPLDANLSSDVFDAPNAALGGAKATVSLPGYGGHKQQAQAVSFDVNEAMGGEEGGEDQELKKMFQV